MILENRQIDRVIDRSGERESRHTYHRHTYVCIYILIYINLYICMYVCTRIFTWLYTCMCVFARNLSVYIWANTHRFVCILSWTLSCGFLSHGVMGDAFATDAPAIKWTVAKNHVRLPRLS